MEHFLQKTFAIPFKVGPVHLFNSLGRRSIVNSHLHSNRPDKVNIRKYCSAYTNQPLPNLTTLRMKMWPNIFKQFSLKLKLGFLQYHQIHLDMDEFLTGASQAVETVSNLLSRGDFNALQPLISEELITEINKNFFRFSEAQKNELRVSKEELVVVFPYELEIIVQNNEGEIDQSALEIYTVFHAVKGYSESQKEESYPLMGLSMPEYRKRLYVMNYIFTKTLNKPDEDWTIKGLNHFKPLASENM